MIKFYKDHEMKIIYLYIFICIIGLFISGRFEDVSYVSNFLGFGYINNESTTWVLKYLFSPAFFLMTYIYFKELPNAKYKTFQADIFSLFVFLLLIFTVSISGFFQLANSTLGKQTNVVLCGDVVKYYINRNSKNVPTSYEVTVRDESNEYVLTLSKMHFDSLHGSKRYCEEWTKGSLGFIYRWK